MMKTLVFFDFKKKQLDRTEFFNFFRDELSGFSE